MAVVSADSSRENAIGIRISISIKRDEKSIIVPIPHSVKAEAVYNTFNREVTPEVPATILKTHPDWNVFLDRESAKLAFHL